MGSGDIVPGKNFGKEAAFHHGSGLTPEKTETGVEKVKAAHGTRHADIEEAALFFNGFLRFFALFLPHDIFF